LGEHHAEMKAAPLSTREARDIAGHVARREAELLSDDLDLAFELVTMSEMVLVGSSRKALEIFLGSAGSPVLRFIERMAERQHFTLPDDFAGALTAWIEARLKSPDWGNARSMRTLLEKAREAQAIRIAMDADADLSRIETEDLVEAMAS